MDMGSATLPLEGLRVLEFSHGGVVPWGDRHLAHRGARSNESRPCMTTGEEVPP